MIKIGNNILSISLHEPDAKNGYYRGTRFDWAGVFESIVFHGNNYTEQWFEHYSPISHDSVCGPAEEFSPSGFEEARKGEGFLKPGVGILKKTDSTIYDRFQLYEILSGGKRKTDVTPNRAIFSHILEEYNGFGYEYVKEIAITGCDRFEITHKITNTGYKCIEGEVYNHNFFL